MSNLQQSVRVYVQATKNEFVVDDCLARDSLAVQWLPVGIPRPLQAAARLGAWKGAVRILFAPVVILWSGLFSLLTLWQAMWMLVRLAGAGPGIGVLSGHVALCFSPRMPAVLKLVAPQRRPDLLVTAPWCRTDDAAPKIATVSLLRLARIRDVVWALGAAHVGAWSYWRKAQSRAERLQTYTAFQWFFAWRVLSRQSDVSSLWFGNHYDRWAVLIDRLPLSADRVMVQHGFARADLVLPIRLMNVNRLCFFDEHTKKVLLQTALPDESRLVMERLYPKLELIPVERPFGRVQLLVISQPVDLEKEALLLAAIQRAFPNVQVWLKPHPLYFGHSAQTFRHTEVQLIQDRNFYPAVDLALSGQSWLGVEYEGTGVPVVWHWGKEIDECIAEISGSLDKIRRATQVRECA